VVTEDDDFEDGVNLAADLNVSDGDAWGSPESGIELDEAVEQAYEETKQE